MLKFITVILLLNYVHGVLYPIAVRLPLKGDPPLPGAALWPKPLKVQQTSKTFYLSRNEFIFYASITKTNYCEREILNKRFKHYLNVIFPPKLDYEFPAKTDRQIKTLTIEIQNSNPVLKDCAKHYYPEISDTETEKYTLSINETNALLVGNTVWGVLRGMETFSQLVYQYKDSSKLALNETYIEDQPRFAFRGLMLDTARHYYPIPLIKKHLDAAFYNKFNVFHWHLTDDQSFPFQSDVYPELWKKGAYTRKHVYSKKDIADLIEFARVRGIRVIPEFDTPGHTASWGLGYPDLITDCWVNDIINQGIYDKHGPKEILNPMKNYTYEFIKNLLEEVKGVFSDPMIHLGMDEVYYNCWESNPNISAWMNANGFTETKDIEQYYMEKVLSIADQLGYKVTVWQDVYDNKVKVFNGTVIQVWKDNVTKWETYVERVTKDGYKVILSSPWYLNYIKYGIDWPEYYKIEPYNFTGTDEQKKLVIGGEACMWAEFVDGTNSLARMWPRASAVAERLWSEATVNDTEEAKYRLDEHRCRMLRRGIDAQPILNGYCGDYEAYFENNVLNEPVFNYYKNNGAIRLEGRIIIIMVDIIIIMATIIFSFSLL